MTVMTEILLQGLLLGGLYALFALGQSLMFGVMRLTNTAWGDFIILVGFFAISLVGTTGLSPGLALVLITPLAFVFDYALQRLVLNGTLGWDALPSLVVTFGLVIIIKICCLNSTRLIRVHWMGAAGAGEFFARIRHRGQLALTDLWGRSCCYGAVAGIIFLYDPGAVVSPRIG